MTTLAQKKQPQSFGEWCKQKSFLPSETQHTIDVLLTKAGTRNCQQAEVKLRTMKKLDLTYNLIGDIQPLNSLNELTELDLSGVQITDLTPLNNLKKLTVLNLSFTGINDLRLLSSLTKLTDLKLENNQIRDIRPLISLNKLTVLSIEKPARDFYIMKSLEKPIQYRT